LFKSSIYLVVNLIGVCIFFFIWLHLSTMHLSGLALSFGLCIGSHKGQS